MSGNPDNKRVFLDITVNGRALGRIVIELFCSMAPITTENFRVLCVGNAGTAIDGMTKLSYKGVSIHRVVKNFMIQGGDISGKEGLGGFSIYGQYFEDEPFIESHSKYMVSMANKGPNTNSSQFFITTTDAQHCDGKHVVFGKVVKGTDVVDAIEKIRTDKDDKPLMDIMISNCGELFKKSKNNNEPLKVVKTEIVEEEEVQEDTHVEEKSEDGEVSEDIPEGPKNWLYREDLKKPERDRKRDRGDRRHKKSRHGNRQSRSRSRSRERHERPRVREDSSGIRIKGRGNVMYTRFRSSTPEHWRINAPTKKFDQRDVQNITGKIV